MTPIRVVLGQLPVLLGDIVRETLSEHPDLEVFGDTSSEAPLSTTVASTDADVAIIGLPASGGLGLADDLLRAHPRLMVVALADNARTACVYQLKTQVTPLRELTPRSLLAAVRQAAVAGNQ